MRNGSLYSESFLEPVLPYDATVDLLETTRAAGLHDNTAEAVGRALFGTFTPPDQPIRLRDHQAESVMHHFRSGVADGRNVVVTSGTGSGKTEAPLLPVLLRIVEESRAWSPSPDLVSPWWSAGQARETWVPVRGLESRPPAVRALVLYPTNALVEDQMTRLRRAVRYLGQRDAGRPLWFGRYTGITMGSTTRPSGMRGSVVAQLAADLRDMRDEHRRLLEAGVSAGDLAQFPDPDVHELMVRWDMVETPPDVLVTNYSMLNAMLMRHQRSRCSSTLGSGSGLTLPTCSPWLSTNSTSTAARRAARWRWWCATCCDAWASTHRRRSCVHRHQRILAGDGSGLEYLEQFFGLPRSASL